MTNLRIAHYFIVPSLPGISRAKSGTRFCWHYPSSLFQMCSLPPPPRQLRLFQTLPIFFLLLINIFWFALCTLFTLYTLSKVWSSPALQEETLPCPCLNFASQNTSGARSLFSLFCALYALRWRKYRLVIVFWSLILFSYLLLNQLLHARGLMAELTSLVAL